MYSEATEYLTCPTDEFDYDNNGVVWLYKWRPTVLSISILWICAPDDSDFFDFHGLHAEIYGPYNITCKAVGTFEYWPISKLQSSHM